jgi:hypothetical protein
MRARTRVDQDQVRGAPTGIAHIIAAGRVERARIIRTRIIRTRVDTAARDAARELVAGGGQPAAGLGAC